MFSSSLKGDGRSFEEVPEANHKTNRSEHGRMSKEAIEKPKGPGERSTERPLLRMT